MVFKIFQVILLASVKYFVTLPYAMLIGLNFGQALISVLIGGIGGFLFFYYLSNRVVVLIDFMRLKLCHFMPDSFKVRFHLFWGIIIATPFILTIPLGAFLANKYYSKRWQTVPFMIMSIVSWAAVLSGVVHIFPKVFF